MAELAVALQEEKDALGQELRAQLAQAVEEQGRLRRLLRLRTRELHRLRHLAQQVLLQRSDVEAFLISSIQIVRAEGAAGAAAGAGGSGEAWARPGSLSDGRPAQPSGGTVPGGSNSGSAKVDIKDLSWVDRERVLRLLFAKVNHQVAAAAAAALSHPLSTEGAEAPPPPALRGAWAEAGPAALA